VSAYEYYSDNKWRDLDNFGMAPSVLERTVVIRQKISLKDGYYAIADLPHAYERMSNSDGVFWYAWNPPKAGWLESDIMNDDCLRSREYVYLGEGE
jgi:hypothetical protein